MWWKSDTPIKSYWFVLSCFPHRKMKFIPVFITRILVVFPSRCSYWYICTIWSSWSNYEYLMQYIERIYRQLFVNFIKIAEKLEPKVMIKMNYECNHWFGCGFSFVGVAISVWIGRWATFALKHRRTFWRTTDHNWTTVFILGRWRWTATGGWISSRWC